MRQRWALCIVALTAGVSMIVGVMIGNASADDAAPALSGVDVGFAQDMLAHHQQAITIVGQLSPQAAPEVRAVADQISGTQLAETGQMRGWLQAAGEPEQSPTPMAWMGSEHAQHSDHTGSAMMPGMADDAELTALHETTGVANEIRFLQLMIRHHQGGISMAQYVRQHGHNSSVTATATQMQDEQSNEVDLMVTLLTARGGAPLPFA
ncbi:DUF305 domain-containing protein [Williamsia sp.]|uniref:DUF305 domain-containing protein n=1 Tax=Williamsia sp. TaxID=1872085 RepID=UPI001A19ADA0|nr:DUF305 domain-containing protein [Williamsia sp.]MBJ7290890.1 DUF305 domain-containing protein [Williamsia sp.]